MSPAHALWAPQAWIKGGWQNDVLMRVARDGRFTEISPNVSAPPDDQANITVLPGPVLPGIVNAHSHAFQRAFAGMAEQRDAEQDDFWGWRSRMYGVALRITPPQLEAVATQLYAELLQGGYTQVCEFHYLQHAPDGSRYADPLTMIWPLLRAAKATGIGLTVLPVLYQRAGFTQPALRDDQRRFATTVAEVLALRDAVRALGDPMLTAGVAIHSLRAADAASITQLTRALAGDDGPIHIHIAEQTGEVDDCLAATGQRPIEWLARQMALDARWQLVHATHTSAAEIEMVARSGAAVVLCPSTEANLGDGLCDLPAWLRAQVPWSIGSDSHVGRQWPAELQLLEYGQRLRLRQRNVAAAPMQGQASTADRLLQGCILGGAAAAGLTGAGVGQGASLSVGARADLLVLDRHADGLLGVPQSQWLSAAVFAAQGPLFNQVWVAGDCRVRDGRCVGQSAIRAEFAAAMSALWPQA